MTWINYYNDDDDDDDDGDDDDADNDDDDDISYIYHIYIVVLLNGHDAFCITILNHTAESKLEIFILKYANGFPLKQCTNRIRNKTVQYNIHTTFHFSIEWGTKRRPNLLWHAWMRIWATYIHAHTHTY